MGQHEHKLEIFRGLIKFKSNVQKIWGVLIFLSIVTAIEVVLGIVKPEILMNSFLNLKLIKIGLGRVGKHICLFVRLHFWWQSQKCFG